MPKGSKQHKKNAREAADPFPAAAPRHKLIIGIDYGTTYSGVSYVTSDKESYKDISYITTWPGELSTSWKTPTRIAYIQENRNFSNNKWGFEVDPKHASYSWTKLLLDKNALPTESDDPSLHNLSGEGMMLLPSFRTAPQVCEDFLRELYIYVSEKLKRQMSVATFDITPMECWITLPAIWSDQAKDATLQAAKNAGFGSRPFDEVFTIAEPEAAAIAALKSFSEPGVSNALQLNEHILICDCGGGTVDITTYTISSLQPRLIFDELCVGVGGKCGSTYIDRNLHALMLTRFGAAYAVVPQSLKGPGSRFMNAFETIKRTFGLNNDTGIREIYPLRMETPDSIYYDEEERIVKLSYDDMKAIFDPVVQEVIKMITQQVMEASKKKDARINRIILVGGFGDSAYLNQELTKWCAQNGNIQLVCPENPQAAVIRGAALRGLENIAPRTKQARRHYGYHCSKQFRDGLDNEFDSYYTAHTGQKFCRNRMTWAIEKGEQIMRGTRRTFTLDCHYVYGQPLAVSFDLCCCALDNPPEYRSNHGVEVIGRVGHELPADFDYGGTIESVRNARTGSMCFCVKLQLEVVFGNKGDNLTYHIIVNDKIVGTASIEFGTASS